jgi:hypothetical protein
MICSAGSDRPFGRIGQMGLVWLLKGARIVALSASAAVIPRARD